MDFQSSSSSATSQPNTSTASSTTIISSPGTSTSAGTLQVSSSATGSSSRPPLQLLVMYPPRSRKRKDKPSSSSAAPSTRQKRIKTIIDCPVALTLLKELGLDRPFFNSGKVLAWALDPTDPAFIRINDYVHQGQKECPGKWYSGGAKVLGILQVMSKVNRLRDDTILSDFNEDPLNVGQLRKMLWHGTPKANVPKILQNGLILPKHDLGFYGPGIYFADRVDLSIAYSCGWSIGYLFLCDVLLGNDIYKTTKFVRGPQIKLGQPGQQPSKIFTVNSIQGCGIWTPNPQGDQLIDGCVWPMGEAIEDTAVTSFFPSRNIYVSFNEMRVIPKYLVKVQLSACPVSKKSY